MSTSDLKKKYSGNIIEILQVKQKILREELEKKDFIISSWIKRNFYDWRGGGPIRRKLLETVHERINDIYTELKASDVKNPPYEDVLLDNLDLIKPGISEENLWHVADSLKTLLPSIGRDEYIFNLLSLERKKMVYFGRIYLKHWSLIIF